MSFILCYYLRSLINALEQETNEQGVIDRVLSKSYISVRSDEEKRDVSQRIVQVLQQEKGQVWLDRQKGTFGASCPPFANLQIDRISAEYPYETHLFLFQRK